MSLEEDPGYPDRLSRIKAALARGRWYEGEERDDIACLVRIAETTKKYFELRGSRGQLSSPELIHGRREDILEALAALGLTK